MKRLLPPRTLLGFLLLFACFNLISCAVALGPGYTIEKQEIQVHFLPTPQPHIQIEAEYQLKNSGNQPLAELEIRLPGERRFRRAEPQARWDGSALPLAEAPANPRNHLLALPQPWAISTRHTLHLSVDFQQSAPADGQLSFSEDAFFLPAQGWAAELLPARGALADGGVPPKKWNLIVRVPQDFMVHPSGDRLKKSRDQRETVVRAEQRVADKYPFVVAGRYVATLLGTGKEKVNLWTRTPLEKNSLQQASAQLVKTLQAYDSVFGDRQKKDHPLWIVECPVAAGCFRQSSGLIAAEPHGQDAAADPSAQSVAPTSAEMISLDTVMVDLSAGAPQLAASAAPSLAASWLGYGQNPGFYEQDPPLSALPTFAAASGREAIDGPAARTATIRRALNLIPTDLPAHTPEPRVVVRAKSLLFFYALQDRYGHEVFRHALQHMFYARQGGGFNLNDLIAAFDEEAHQFSTAEFVRTWMKRPGVPQEFRARYENVSVDAPSANLTKETNP